MRYEISSFYRLAVTKEITPIACIALLWWKTGKENNSICLLIFSNQHYDINWIQHCRQNAEPNSQKVVLLVWTSAAGNREAATNELSGGTSLSRMHHLKNRIQYPIGREPVAHKAFVSQCNDASLPCDGWW